MWNPRWILFALVCVTACDRRGQDREGPLTVERYEELLLQPLALDSAARRGDTITFTLGGERLQIQLQPRNLVGGGCTVIELREQPVSTPCPPDLGTYSGGIVSDS